MIHAQVPTGNSIPKRVPDRWELDFAKDRQMTGHILTDWIPLPDAFEPYTSVARVRVIRKYGCGKLWNKSNDLCMSPVAVTWTR